MTEQPVAEFGPPPPEGLEDLLRATFDEVLRRTPSSHEVMAQMGLLGSALRGAGFEPEPNSSVLYGTPETTAAFVRSDGSRMELKFSVNPDTYRSPSDQTDIERHTSDALASVLQHSQLFGDEYAGPAHNQLIIDHFWARERYRQTNNSAGEAHLRRDATGEIRGVFGDFNFAQELEMVKRSQHTIYGFPAFWYYSVAQSAVSMARAGKLLEADLLAGSLVEREGNNNGNVTQTVVAAAELALAGSDEARQRAIELYNRLPNYLRAEVGALMAQATGDMTYANETHDYAMSLRINPGDSTRDSHRLQRAVIFANLSRFEGYEGLDEARELAESINDLPTRIHALAELGRAGDRESLQRAIDMCREHQPTGLDAAYAYAAIALATAEALRPPARQLQADSTES